MQIYNEEKSLYDFIESGTNLKDSKVSIIDIRSNSGGRDIWSMEWFKNYTGQYPEPKGFNAQKYSRVFLESMRYVAENTTIEGSETSGNLEIANELLNKKEFEVWNTRFRDGAWIKNDNIIFVLMDKYVASSGESFISYLRTLDNVIFVGTNTAGCGLVSNNFHSKLPNSNIELYFGTGLVLTSTGKSIDGIGFKPDIWINGKDSLDKVIKLISSYELK